MLCCRSGTLHRHCGRWRERRSKCRWRWQSRRVFYRRSRGDSRSRRRWLGGKFARCDRRRKGWRRCGCGWQSRSWIDRRNHAFVHIGEFAAAGAAVAVNRIPFAAWIAPQHAYDFALTESPHHSSGRARCIAHNCARHNHAEISTGWLRRCGRQRRNLGNCPRCALLRCAGDDLRLPRRFHNAKSSGAEKSLRPLQQIIHAKNKRRADQENQDGRQPTTSARWRRGITSQLTSAAPQSLPKWLASPASVR